MSFKALYLALVICGWSWFANAQNTPIYTSKSLAGNTLTIISDSGHLDIIAYKPNLIKIQFSKKSDILAAIGKVDSANLNIRVTQNLVDVFFATDSLWVIVNKYDLSIRFVNRQNEQLLLKSESYFIGNHGEELTFLLHTDDKPKLSDFKNAKRKQVRISGEHRLCNPVLVSAKRYALLVENPSNKKVEIRFLGNSKVMFTHEKTKNTKVSKINLVGFFFMLLIIKLIH